MTDVGLGVTTTLAIPTATKAVPLTPSTVAVIVTVPALSPVTRPVLETGAIDSLLDDHPTTRSVSTVVPERTVGTSTTNPLTARLLDVGAMVTLVTGICLTLTSADPVLPSIVAKMTALPLPTAVTTPAADTVATKGAPDVHDAGRFGSTAPRESLAVAVRVAACPTVRSDDPG